MKHVLKILIFALCLGAVHFSQAANWLKNVPESESLPPLPVEAQGPTGACLGKCVYVLAGNELFALNLNDSEPKWTCKAPLPAAAREDAAAAVQCGNQKITGLFVFGGLEKGVENPQPLSDAWFYDPGADRWTELAPLPEPLAGATAKPSGALSILIQSPGHVLAYHTVPNSYAELSDVPTAPVRRHFGWLNWAVLLAYLALMLPFGYIFMRRSKGNAEDYFKGGGRIPWWVNGFSIYATMLSSITFIAIPTMVFLGDWRYYPNAFMIFVTAIVVIFCYIPRFRKLNLTCAYEYLEQRYNLFTRLFASSAFIVFMVARSAVVMFIPSLTLNAVAGIDIYTSILLVGGVTLIYSTIGGMEAVAWADFIQAVILVGGAILVCVFLVTGSGGFSHTIEIAWTADKLRFWDFGWDWSQPVLWVAILGGFAQNLTSYTSDQTIVQRYVTMKNTRDTNRSLWMNGILSIFGLCIFYFIGTGLYTFYHTNPGAFDVVLSANDAVFPTYMVTQLPSGLAGLLIASVFAATMSTISGNFNSSSAAFVTDFFCRFSKHTPGDRSTFHVSICATAVTGLLAILCTIFLATLPDMKSLFDVFLTTIGVLTGGLCGLFFMGFFMPYVRGFGAICGLFTSYAVNLVIIFNEPLGIPLPSKPHSLLYAAISLGTCLLVGSLAGLAERAFRR